MKINTFNLITRSHEEEIKKNILKFYLSRWFQLYDDDDDDCDERKMKNRWKFFEPSTLLIRQQFSKEKRIYELKNCSDKYNERR